jgi:ribonuclease BN (tRNA processing enzyme)
VQRRDQRRLLEQVRYDEKVRGRQHDPPLEAIVEHSRGCDVLIHEVYAQASYRSVTPKWQRYRRAYHTSSRELAAIANEARPGLLVLYHRGSPGAIGRPNPECVVLDEVRQLYNGAVITGHDLAVF